MQIKGSRTSENLKVGNTGHYYGQNHRLIHRPIKVKNHQQCRQQKHPRRNSVGNNQCSKIETRFRIKGQSTFFTLRVHIQRICELKRFNKQISFFTFWTLVVPHGFERKFHIQLLWFCKVSSSSAYKQALSWD